MIKLSRSRLRRVSPFSCNKPTTGRLLLLNVHYYPAYQDYNFTGLGLPSFNSQWANYLGQYTILIGETGINNFGTNLDPKLNGPSVNPTAWVDAISASIDFLTWAKAKTNAGLLNGVIGEMWYGYLPGAGVYDYNTMTYNDGSLTDWGIIFYSYSLH